MRLKYEDRNNIFLSNYSNRCIENILPPIGIFRAQKLSTNQDYFQGVIYLFKI